MSTTCNLFNNLEAAIANNEQKQFFKELKILNPKMSVSGVEVIPPKDHGATAKMKNLKDFKAASETLQTTIKPFGLTLETVFTSKASTQITATKLNEFAGSVKNDATNIANFAGLYKQLTSLNQGITKANEDISYLQFFQDKATSASPTPTWTDAASYDAKNFDVNTLITSLRAAAVGNGNEVKELVYSLAGSFAKESGTAGTTCESGVIAAQNANAFTAGDKLSAIKFYAPDDKTINSVCVDAETDDIVKALQALCNSDATCTGRITADKTLTEAADAIQTALKTTPGSQIKTPAKYDKLDDAVKKMVDPYFSALAVYEGEKDPTKLEDIFNAAQQGTTVATGKSPTSEDINFAVIAALGETIQTQVMNYVVSNFNADDLEKATSGVHNGNYVCKNQNNKVDKVCVANLNTLITSVAGDEKDLTAYMDLFYGTNKCAKDITNTATAKGCSDNYLTKTSTTDITNKEIDVMSQCHKELGDFDGCDFS